MLATVASLVIGRHGGGLTILFGLGMIGAGLYRMFASLSDADATDAVG
jgi:hypothetical protein